MFELLLMLEFRVRVYDIVIRKCLTKRMYSKEVDRVLVRNVYTHNMRSQGANNVPPPSNKDSYPILG